MLGITCNHFPWTPHTIGRRQAWHTIIAFRLHTWLDDVRHGMQSYTLVITYNRMTSSVSCYRHLLTSHIVGRRQSWNARMSLGQETRSDDVGRGMPSSPLDNIQGQTISPGACYHFPWTEHTVRRRRAWHAIIYLGLHIQSKDVERVMLSSSFDFTHGRTMSGMTCTHVPWAANTVGRRRARHAIITLRQHTR